MGTHRTVINFIVCNLLNEKLVILVVETGHRKEIYQK